MQRVLLLLLMLLGLSLQASARAQEPGPAWWQADWKYRKPLTVDAGPQGAGLATGPGRLPVLVRLHAGNFAFDGVGEGGRDLRFIAADGHTVLNHQVERYDAAAAMALVWVDVPAVTPGAAQTLWMYYGNPQAPAAGNGQLVFDPDYTAVYHFAGTTAQVQDTTAYGNHASGPLTALEAALIGRGAQLGTAPFQLPASASLAVPAGGTMSFSAWVKPEAAGPGQSVYLRRDGEHLLWLGVDNGVPFVQVDQARSAPVAALPSGQWSHLAFTADAGAVVLYVGGREVARVETPLPALAGPAWVGGEGTPAPAGAVAAAPFTGALDEVRLSKVARPAAALLAEVASQGPAARLVRLGEDEQNAGVSHFGFILKSMPVDAWVVVIVLGLMLLLSWAIMLAKGRYFGRVSRANAAFAVQYQQVAGLPAASLQERARQGTLDADIREHASLWRLYAIAMDELKGRQAHAHGLSAAALAAIRAAMDAEVIREGERMSRRMNWLSTTIEGAPYVGLFGTVIGIMLVFAVAAMAGAVDINSVAPGMAAALLCTAAGLGVAIPALFGYNWLAARAEAIGADMAVFVDEFSARLAEEFDAAGPVPSVLHSVRA